MTTIFMMMEFQDGVVMEHSVFGRTVYSGIPLAVLGHAGTQLGAPSSAATCCTLSIAWGIVVLQRIATARIANSCTHQEVQQAVPQQPPPLRHARVQQWAVPPPHAAMNGASPHTVQSSPWAARRTRYWSRWWLPHTRRSCHDVSWCHHTAVARPAAEGGDVTQVCCVLTGHSHAS